MIKTEKINYIPQELLDNLNPIACTDIDSWTKIAEFVLGLSAEVRYVTDEANRPLLLIGAFRQSLVAKELEIWMLGSSFIRPRFLRDFRKVFLDWRREREEKVFARIRAGQGERFVKFMGFEEVGPSPDDKDTIIYEVPRWL